MARFLILAGFFLIASGLVLHFKIDIPYLAGWIGQLPGDIVIRKKHLIIYFPLMTSLLLSAVVSIVLSCLFKRSQ